MNTPKSQKNSERLKANMEHLGRKVSLMFQTSRQTSRSRTDLTEEIGVISAPTGVTHNTGIKAEEDGAIKGIIDYIPSGKFSILCGISCKKI